MGTEDGGGGDVAARTEDTGWTEGPRAARSMAAAVPFPSTYAAQPSGVAINGLRGTGEPPSGNLCNLDRNRPALLQATLPTELSYKSVKTARSPHPGPVYHLAEFFRVKVREGGQRNAPRNWVPEPGTTILVQGATHS